MSTPEDEAVKREFIEAYFEDLDNKVEFLSELEASEHSYEAQLLALVYLDGLANWLEHPVSDSPRNFRRILIDHGGDEQFHLIIPRWLLNALPWKSAPAGAESAIRRAIDSLGADDAHPAEPLLDLVSSDLTEKQREWLHKEIWRGSVANAVYATLRCPGVHMLASDHGISFSSTKWQGETLERVGLDRLLASLRKIARYAREHSLATNDWFGQI